MNKQENLPATDAEDDQLQQRLDSLAKEYAEHPLFDELRQLARQYQRLERKLHKIARISDRMQAQILELNQQLGEKAITDPLTGLLNRRGMYECLEVAAGHLDREQRAFGVLLLDLDYFKQVNDSYGHQVGDELLVELGSALRHNLRVYDCCARWGGEEFLLLLQDCTTESLASVAKKMLDMVRTLEVASIPDSHLLTASIGCYLCQQVEPLDEVIRKADAAMYRAKEMGRNGLVLCAS